MITVTPQATEKLKELMAEETAIYLRVFVQGGGCSGFQYGLLMQGDEDKSDADQVFESNGIKVIVDPVSISYLKDAEVEYVDGPTGSGFSIKNPNATSTCGCGSSFNTD